MEYTVLPKFNSQDLTTNKLDMIYEWVKNKDIQHFGLILSVLGIFYDEDEVIKFCNNTSKETFYDDLEIFINNQLKTKTFEAEYNLYKEIKI